MLRVELHPDAAAELEAGVQWYESQALGLGDDFLHDVEAGVVAVRESPDRWPVFEGVIRRYLLHRFPYGLLYFASGDVIHVLAVMHLHRRPGYWQRR